MKQSTIKKQFETKDVFEAMALSGLDFEVITETCPTMARPDGNNILLPGHIHYNADKNEYLGWTSDKYTVTPNKEAFDFTDEFHGKVTWIQGDKDMTGRFFLIGELDKITILGDTFTPYLSVQNSFNGRYQIAVSISTLRDSTQSQISLPIPSCQNNITIRHQKGYQAKVDTAKKVLESADSYLEEFGKVASGYAKQKISKIQLSKVLEEVFPISPDAKDFVAQRIEQQKNEFLVAYNTNENSNFRGTVWGLVMAYADYMTHKSPTSAKKKEKFEDKLRSNLTFNGNEIYGDFISKAQKAIAEFQSKGF